MLKKLPFAVEIALLILLAFILSHTFWNILYPFSSSYDQQTMTRPELRAVPDPGHPYSGEVWNIFGVYKQEAAPPSHKDRAGSIASGVELTAIFLTERQTGSAVIRNQEGVERNIRIGEEVQPGLLLSEIHKDFVLASDGSQETILHFPDQSQWVKKEMAEPYKRRGEAALSERQEELREQNLTPVSTASPEGYRVGEDSKFLIERHRLQIGDILVSINGYPLGNEIADAAAFNSFKQSGSYEMLVRREDKEIVLRLQ